MINIKNGKNNKLIKAFCIFLCVLMFPQAVLAADNNIGDADNSGGLHPQLDEMLDYFAEYNLHGLTRDEAFDLMLKNFLTHFPEAVPLMGDSLLRALDGYGGYYPQTSLNAIFNSSGEYWGYGIIMTGKIKSGGYNYGVLIDKLVPYSPAAYSGLKPGDEIIGVDDINVEGLGMIAVSNLLATYEDEVVLTVIRDGETKEFGLYKSSVFIPPVSLETDEETSTGIIKITAFLDFFMVSDLYDALFYLKYNGYENLIIDLRGNSGGNMWYMFNSLNLFVPEEGVELCSLKERDSEPEGVFSSEGGFEFDKICILADRNTASAAEIFALSMRELTGAAIIGERTYGKGVGQYYITMESGDIIAITAFEIFSAHGNGYNKEGIYPDIKILPDVKIVESTEFAQLNFVNIAKIKEGAENSAVLALNQRLSRMGYLSPEDAGEKCTDKTITAVEILQKYNKLPVGLSKIDYNFLEALNYYVSRAAYRYEEADAQFECAMIYITDGWAAAEEYARGFEK